MRVTFLTPAAEELDDAFEYYQSEMDGLGYKFQQAIHQSISRIVHFPTSYQKIGKHSRRCLAHRFPYSVVYVFNEDSQEMLVLVIIAHLHRNPDYWLSREG